MGTDDAPRGAEEAPGRGAIHRIDAASVHLICSGQVVLDLATAVKELVENALDAGTTTIDVRLREYGSELIEVADDGVGISPDDYESLTLKYHTSKLATFDDLGGVATFGFRGEALSSLCAASDLSVVTRRRGEDSATKLTFDPDGVLLSREPAARAPGTTVCVANLFARMPVRRSELLRQSRRELGKAATVLQAYAIFSPSVRFLATHHAGSTSRSTLVSTRGGGRARECLVQVLGPKAADGLEPVDFDLGQAGALDDEETEGGDGGAPASQRPGEGDAGTRRVRLVGYVSKASAAGRKSPADRQYFAVNGRPVDLPRLVKVLNECFRALASPGVAARPACVLDLRLPRDAYDVNVTPDKRTVFLHDERRIVDAVRSALKAHWEPSRSKYKINGGGSQAIKQEPTQLPFSQFLAADKGGASRAGGLSQGLSRHAFGRFSQGTQRDEEEEEAEEEEGGGDGEVEDAGGGVGHGAPVEPAKVASAMRPAGGLGRFRAGAPPPSASPDAEAAELEALANAMEEHDGECGEPEAVVDGPEAAAIAGKGGLAGVCANAEGLPGVEATSTARATGLACRDTGGIAPVSQPSDGDARGSQRSDGDVRATQRSDGDARTSQRPEASPPFSPAGLLGVKRSLDKDPPVQRAKVARTTPPSLASFLMGRAGASGAAEARPVVELGSFAAVARTEGTAPGSAVGVDDAEPRDLALRALGHAPPDAGAPSTPRGTVLAATSDLDRSPPSPTYSPPRRVRETGSPPSARRGLKLADELSGRGVLAERGGGATETSVPAERGGNAAKGAANPLEAAARDGKREAEPDAAAPEAPTLGPSEGTSADRQGDGASPSTGEGTLDDGHPPSTSDASFPALSEGPPSISPSPDEGAGFVDRHAGPSPEPGAPRSPPDPEASHPAARALPPCAGVVPVDLAALANRAVRRRAARRAARRGDAAAAATQASATSPTALAALSAASLAPGHDDVSGEQSLVRATEELELSFDKADFRNMAIVGQFNLGFIVTRLGRNLFVVDQHASDEKSTFERLQETLKLQRQPLLLPVDLGLSPSEELTVREHPDVFALNGFAFREDPETGRLALSATPLGRGASNLGPDDVRELIGVLQGDDVEAHGAGLLPLWTTAKTAKGRKIATVPRPSRVRAMLASKACRSSVMIGKALAKKDMRRIVDRLSDLESPWNCPHGRPTMRHLYTLPSD